MAAYSAGISIPDFWRMTMWELGACLAARIDAMGGESFKSPDEIGDALSRISVKVDK